MHIAARVAGEEFARFHIDIASNDAIVGDSDYFEGSSLLAFTNIDSIEFPIYPVPQQLAEKLHAYTLPRSVVNTRTKDLVDMVMLTTIEIVDAGVLQASLKATFDRRGTHAVPRELPPPPSRWAAPFTRLAASASTMPTQELGKGWSLAAEFWNPILSDEIGAAIWLPVPHTWTPTDDRKAWIEG
jgi:hypothetical protein